MVYRLWRKDPRHPGLHFKKTGQLWSIRIGGGYRALAVREGEMFVWFWIGNHDEYARFIAQS